MATTFGVETEVIDLDQATEMWPLLNTDDLIGALYTPTTAKHHPSTQPSPWPRAPKREVPGSSKVLLWRGW